MVKSLLEQHVPDAVDAVNLLPPSRNLSCFAIMRSPEDAALAISYLDGEAVDGKTLSVTYPRPPKRSRAAEQDAILEIRGLPSDVSAADLSSLVEVTGREVHSVKILRHGSIKDAFIGLVHMSPADAAIVVDELHNLEFSPGYVLQVKIRADSERQDGPKQVPQPPPHPPRAALTAPIQRPSHPIPPVEGPRRKGGVVGRLAYTKDDYMVSHQARSRTPKPPATPPGADAWGRRKEWSDWNSKRSSDGYDEEYVKPKVEDVDCYDS